MPALSHPLAAGQWHLRRNGVLCRLAHRTVSITAPAPLVGDVLALCKGQLSWREVAAQLRRRWCPEQVEPFLRALAEEGVLVEPEAPGPAALPAGSQGDPTFSGDPVSSDALALVLHRAGDAAPAGVRWFALVLQDPGAGCEDAHSLVPGLYRAEVRDHGGVAFIRSAWPSSSQAWRLLRDPRALAFASSVVLPVGDARHTMAVGEIGRCLQNAQCQLPALGLAGQVRTDVSPTALPEWLGEEGLAAPAALLLGMPASPEQAARERAVRWMQLRPARPWREEAPASGRPSAHAFVSGPVRLGSGGWIDANGRAADPREAATKAEAEAWERLGWATLGDACVARAGDLDGALDPRSVTSYTQSQYRRAGFPWQPYSPRKSYAWVCGRDAWTDETVRLPAECIHALSALPLPLQQRACTSASTSGVAAWTDADGALCRAALELVERDAFLKAWIGQAPVPLLWRESLPQPARRRVQALEAAGHRVAIAQLASSLACVFAVFVQCTYRPFTAIVAAADLQAEPALDRALHEAEARALHAAVHAGKPLHGARAVASIDDIGRLYRSRRWYRRADFFAAGPESQRFAGAAAPCVSWAQLKERLAGEGRRLLAFDLTPRNASLHQGRTPLHVMRAVIPGLLPIWFRAGLEPAGLQAYRDAAHAHPSVPRRHPLPLHPFT